MHPEDEKAYASLKQTVEQMRAEGKLEPLTPRQLEEVEDMNFDHQHQGKGHPAFSPTCKRNM